MVKMEPKPGSPWFWFKCAPPFKRYQKYNTIILFLSINTLEIVTNKD